MAQRLLVPLVLLVLCTCMVVALQASWQPGVGYDNIYVPDSYIYYEFLVDSLVTSWFSSLVLDGTSSPGVYFFYYPFFFFSDKLCVVPNLTMLAACIYLCERIFGRISPVAARLAALAIIFNPYLLLGVTGPNKETPLTLAVLLFAYAAVVRRSNIWTLIAIAMAGFFRLPYGIILAGCWGLLTLARRKAGLGWLLLLVPIGMSFLLPLLSTDRLGLAGSYSTYASGEVTIDYVVAAQFTSDNPLAALPFYIFRCLGNAFTNMVRFSPTTDRGTIALLGAGYGIFGLAMAAGMVNLFLTIKDRTILYYRERNRRNRPQSGPDRKLMNQIHPYILICTFAWLCVSLNLFIHARYLMPILPLLFGILGATLNKRRGASIFLVLCCGFLTYFAAKQVLQFRDTPKVTAENYKPEFLP